MAYNPFDDVIDQDPAYMANGGQLPKPKIGIEFLGGQQEPVQPERSVQPQRSIYPTRRVNYVDDGQSELMADIAREPVNIIGDLFAQTIGRVAENMVDPEAAERGRQKFAIRKEAQKMFGKTPQQMTADDIRFYEQRTGNKYEQLSFVEGINQGLDFILGDAIAGSQEIRDGKRFSELDGTKQLGVALLPLEFWLGGLGLGAAKVVQKVGPDVLQKYKRKTLNEIVNDPQARQEMPEVVGEIENQFPILKSQTIRRETTERPNEMDLVASQSDALEEGRLRFKTGMPNRQTLDARTKIDNFLNKLDPKQTTTAPEIAKVTGLPYTQVDSLVRSFNYKNNPQIVKAQSGDAPLFFKNYKIKNDPEGELAAIPTYLRDMSANFNKQYGRKPTAPELQLFIKQTETNPEVVEYFSKTPLSRMQGFKSNKDQLEVSAAQKQPIKNLVKQELEKNTPEAITFKSALDVAEQDLKRDITKANAFSFAFNRNKKIFEPIFGSGKSGKGNFTRYMKQERGVEPRMDRLDAPGSPIPQQSAKKINRAEQQLTFMLESKKIGKNKKYDTDIARDTSMFRFLTQKYRGMINDEGGILNPEDFMDYYVMPFKGSTKEETIANLAKEYNKKIGANDIEEFNEFLKVDNKYLRLRDLTESLMDELKLSGKYTDEQLEQINLSIRPNFGHAYPIKKTNAKGRFEGLSSDARFLRAQPAVYNVSYQNTLDGTMQKIIDTVNKPKNIEELKVQKPTIIIPEKNLEKVGVSINKDNYENQLEYLTALAEKVNTAMIDKGLISILAQSKKSKNVLDVMKKNYDDRSAAYFFGGPEKSPEEYIKMIRESLLEMGPDLKYVKENITGRVGGKRAKPMVKMAIGGDPLQNINQQQFAPDPAVDQDFFQEAVDSGNLYAFNPLKLFKLFGKVDGVQTPKKITTPEAVDAPPGTTLPATQVVQPEDFPFRSFTLESILDPNAPKAATPQAWADFLVKGKKSPVSEIQDSGLEQYLRDFEKYYPNQKVTQQQLVDYYETSPIGNISFRVKDEARLDPPVPRDYERYVGRPRHQNAGNQRLDQQGEDYREIVVEAGALPGEKKPFVQSGHYSEPNVIGFTRVATYTQPDGKRVAVIQELQTDMLATVRKEQERLEALLKRIQNLRTKGDRLVQSVDSYDRQSGEAILNELNSKFPPTVLQKLEENKSLIKPFPNEAAKAAIPDYAKRLSDLSKEIEDVVKLDLKSPSAKSAAKIMEIQKAQDNVLSDLMDLNRSGQLDDILGDVKVPNMSQSDDLANYASDPNARMIEGNYDSGKKLELFPPVPFNKQPDYVDLLLKATIKDAQSKGIIKVAIYPPDLVNKRWGKTPGSDAAKKFEDLYGKVSIQQMKNIAKKYGGTARFENISDPTKAEKGLRFLNREVDGTYKNLKETQIDDTDTLNEQLSRFASNYKNGQVTYTREVAPGQYQDFYVNIFEDAESARPTFKLDPLGPDDDINKALVRIEEFNPQEVPMFTITLDSPKAEQPMYLFKKKDGGTIAKDSLVSITDIYGQYGR